MKVLQAHLAAHVAPVLQPEEFLRAEWVARVAALDLYVHELVAQRMVDIFEGHRPATPAYLKFQVSTETLGRIRTAATVADATAAFDLDVRTQLRYVTYQDPERIAEGVRLCSTVELWNEIAAHLGATVATKNAAAKALKRDLSLIVERRNKIAHEGDLQPVLPREPWPISAVDVAGIATTIDRIVRATDAVVT